MRVFLDSTLFASFLGTMDAKALHWAVLFILNPILAYNLEYKSFFEQMPYLG